MWQLHAYQRRYFEAWKRFRLVWVYTQWWVPSLNLLEAWLQPELWNVSVVKGLEDLEASVVLGGVEHRPPRTSLISADGSYKM